MSGDSERRIPLSAPVLKGNEWKYLCDCLESGWISSAGQFVGRLESAVAARASVTYAVATSSGTAALHLALIACGVSPGDEVILPALTFIAPANAVRYVGANPVFIDVEPRSLQLDAAALDQYLEENADFRDGRVMNRKTGRRICAILPVHLLGHSADMDAISKLAENYQVDLIEDASEALGAKHRDRPVGSMGRAGCLSFNGNKTITCGGGGMLLTNDALLASRARHLSTQARVPGEEFVHDSVGFNYRLTSLQAAVGIAQLEQLDEFLESKQRIYEFYRQEIGCLDGVSMIEPPKTTKSSFWLTTVRIVSADARRSARTLRKHLAASGVESRTLWQPLHMSPAMKGAVFGECANAERAYAECLCLPSSPSLSSDDLSYICSRFCSHWS